MRWILIWVLCALPLRADEVPGALTFVMVNGGYTEVPLERLVTGHLAVEVRLNGQRGLFLVDSGASRSILDVGRAGLYPLGDVTSVQAITGVVGDLTVRGRAVSVYKIGSVTGFDAAVYVADLAFVAGAIAELGGPVVDGVLGQDWLTTHEAVIDMAGDRMFLRP